nr:type IIL restriction-modification enzyme MmeI [Thioalkalivibrio sp. ALgr3]
MDWSEVVPPSSQTYVFGNPPFNGSKTLSAKQTEDRNHACQEVKGHGDLDFVSGWYVKAINYIQGTTTRCALVSTNSITQGEQVGVLFRYLLDRGLKIQFAHRTFRWRNEARGVAAVHCVIIGFGLQDVPKKRLFEYGDPTGEPMEVEVENINPYLVDGPDVLLASRNKPLCPAPTIRTGNKPIDGGFYLFTPEEKVEFLAKEPQAEPYFRRWIGSQEFINGIERWVLWLGDCSPAELKRLPHALKLVEAVRQYRLGEGPNKKGNMPKKQPPASTQALAKKPTRFHIESIPEGRYLVLPEVSSERRPYIPFGYLDEQTYPSNLVKVAFDAEPYHFGVLCSYMHMAWVRAVCGRMKSDYRYSVQIVYNNFPWPTPTDAQRRKIESTAQGILDARSNHPDSTLADLYDPLTMPDDLRKAHEANDRAVDQAYGRRSFRVEAERVGYLFERYIEAIGQ